MADRLTQLQDCLDDLATQMFASLRYINTHHSYASIPGQPDMNPFPLSNGAANPTNGGPNSSRPGTSTQPATQPPTEPQQPQNQTQLPPESTDPRPDPPQVFTASLKELARDLVLKEQQIEYLISVLPGIGSSQEQQNARIQELETELASVLGQRKEVERRRERGVDMIAELAGGCRRVI